jgi:hypothetical protein
MNPAIMQAIATQRVSGSHAHAAAERRAHQIRQARRARRRAPGAPVFSIAGRRSRPRPELPGYAMDDAA